MGLCLICSGCTLSRGIKDYIEYNDTANDFVLGYRNRVWSLQAWHERKPLFEGQPELRAFGEGFRDGYTDVANGGDGCPPPIPPRRYWNWRYQTPEGQCKVAAWFEGYPHGARAAEEEGAGAYQEIQVSYLVEAEYSPAFQSGYAAPGASSPEVIDPGEPHVNPHGPRGEPPPQLPPSALEGPLTDIFTPEPRLSATVGIPAIDPQLELGNVPTEYLQEAIGP